MSIEQAGDVASALSTLPEGWNQGEWPKVLTALNLTEKQRIGRRLTLAWAGMPDLHIWANNDGGHTIQADLAVHWQDEDSLEDSSSVSSEMMEAYGTARDQIAARIGSPSFAGTSADAAFPEDHPAEALAVWPVRAGCLSLAMVPPRSGEESPWVVTLLLEPPLAA